MYHNFFLSQSLDTVSCITLCSQNTTMLVRRSDLFFCLHSDGIRVIRSGAMLSVFHYNERHREVKNKDRLQTDRKQGHGKMKRLLLFSQRSYVE